MAVTKSLGAIKFSYQYADIFDVVNLLTNEIAATILDGSGIPQTDELGISEDENYTVIQKMKDGADEVFMRLIKITNGIADSVVLSATSVECSIKDKQGYNENVLAAIDRLIEKAIINYIIKDWFIDKKVIDHAKIYSDKYVSNIQEIVKKSIQLRKPTLA